MPAPCATGLSQHCNIVTRRAAPIASRPLNYIGAKADGSLPCDFSPTNTPEQVLLTMSFVPWFSRLFAARKRHANQNADAFWRGSLPRWPFTQSFRLRFLPLRKPLLQKGSVRLFTWYRSKWEFVETLRMFKSSVETTQFGILKSVPVRCLLRELRLQDGRCEASSELSRIPKDKPVEI